MSGLTAWNWRNPLFSCQLNFGTGLTPYAPFLTLWSIFGTLSRHLRAILACHKEPYFLSTLCDDSSQTRPVAHVCVLVHNLPHATHRCRLGPIRGCPAHTSYSTAEGCSWATTGKEREWSSSRPYWLGCRKSSASGRRTASTAETHPTRPSIIAGVSAHHPRVTDIHAQTRSVSTRPRGAMWRA